MCSKQRDAEGARGPKWIGSVFSIFLPCFGFVWAGQYKRAGRWLVALIASGTVAVTLLAFAEVPIAIVALFILLTLGIQFASYVKSYQRGKMTAAKWGAFIIYGLIVYLAPMPAIAFARAFRIPSESMAPTFQGALKNGQGDHVIANKLSYLFADPQRGDILAFDTSKVPTLSAMQGPDNQTFYCFRVLGLPGEQLEIRDGRIFEDGRELGTADGVPPFRYLSAAEITRGPAQQTTLPKLAENEYLVFGDNSANSYDSRFWGVVPRSAIVGKITRIYYPFSRIDAPLFPERPRAPE